MLTAALAALVLRQTAAPYVPTQTSVLILPPVDASGDKQAATSQEEIAEAKTTLQTLFASRGFSVVADAATATTTAAVDFTVAANRTVDNLVKIGTAANARLVVFTLVEKTGQKMKEHFMSSHVEGFVTLRTWLVDVPGKHALLDDAKKTVDSTSLGKVEKNRQVHAVHIALDEQLHGFLRPYPETKK